MIGDNGNDSLYGGADDDRYIYYTTSGIDAILDDSGTGDQIRFGEYITFNDLSFYQENNDVRIVLNAGESEILVQNQLDGSATNVIETLFFTSDSSTHDFTSVTLNYAAVTINDLVSSIDYYGSAIIAEGWSNTSTTNVVPVMSSDTNVDGVSSASGVWVTPSYYYSAWRAFDGSDTTKPWADTQNGSNWIDYEFTEAKVINKYTVESRGDHSSYATTAPKDWTLEASVDGLNWTVFDTVSGETSWGLGEARTYEFNNKDFYTHYRLAVSDNNGNDALAIGEIQFIEAQESYQAFIDTDIALFNFDSDIISGLEIRLSGHQDGITDEVLSVSSPSGVTASYTQDGSDYLLTLSGEASVEDYEAALETLAYSNMNTSPTVGARSIEIIIIDEDEIASAPHYVTINVSDYSAPIIENYVSLVKHYAMTVFSDGAANDSVQNSVTAMTSNSSVEGTVTSSGVWNSTFPAWRAFNGDLSGKPWADTQNGNNWIDYEFSEAKAINKYTVASRADHSSYATTAPKDWTLEASVDGINWVVLDTVTGETGWGLGETRTYDFTNGGEFTHYRLVISENNGNAALAIGELQFIEAQSTYEQHIDTNITLSDTDGGFITGAEIVLSDPESAITDEVLSVVTQGGIIQNYSEVSGTYVLTLSGHASVTTYEAVLETLTYQNTDPSLTYFSQTVSVSITDDQNLTSSVQSVEMNIQGEVFIEGTVGDDQLYGSSQNDALYGNGGEDILYGNDGADIFVFRQESAFNDITTIADFDDSESDAIDISDLLSAYDPMMDAITDFVQITDDSTDSTLYVDADGGADSFVAVASILGVTGLTDEATLETNGALITS